MNQLVFFFVAATVSFFLSIFLGRVGKVGIVFWLENWKGNVLNKKGWNMER